MTVESTVAMIRFRSTGIPAIAATCGSWPIARNCCPRRVRKKNRVRKQNAAMMKYVTTGTRISTPWSLKRSLMRSSIAYWIVFRSTVFRSPYPCGSTIPWLWKGMIDPTAKRNRSW